MKIIKVTCLLCKQEYMTAIDEICWPCSSHAFLLKLDEKNPKSKFWKNAKDFALWSLLYIPIPVIIAQQFGFGYELAWIGGGVFIQFLSPFHRWLLSKI
jgi:hypothetical protein